MTLGCRVAGSAPARVIAPTRGQTATAHDAPSSGVGVGSRTNAGWRSSRAGYVRPPCASRPRRSAPRAVDDEARRSAPLRAEARRHPCRTGGARAGARSAPFVGGGARRPVLIEGTAELVAAVVAAVALGLAEEEEERRVGSFGGGLHAK